MSSEKTDDIDEVVALRTILDVTRQQLGRALAGAAEYEALLLIERARARELMKTLNELNK